MKKFLIFKDGVKVASYEAEEMDLTSNNRSYLLCPPHAEHLELPEEMDEDSVSLIEGELVVDNSKRQIKAQANLDAIRQLREPLLKEVDNLINEKEDHNEDASTLRTYRIALRVCTDELKKVNGEAKLICENLVASEFEFPVKPE